LQLFDPAFGIGGIFVVAGFGKTASVVVFGEVVRRIDDRQINKTFRQSFHNRKRIADNGAVGRQRRQRSVGKKAAAEIFFCFRRV